MTLELRRTYDGVRFTPAAIRAALSALPCPPDYKIGLRERTTKRGPDQWTFNDDEEFFAEYGREPEQAHFTAFSEPKEPPPYDSLATLTLWVYGPETNVTVSAGSRGEIEAVFNVLGERAEACRIPSRPRAKIKPVVFIGHGHSPAWRDLKDHLQDLHGISVQAYETGARSGHVIRDILDGMTRSANFAVLVMTGEDEQSDGVMRPRENVVHEVGLFQGRLGFERAVALVEDGVAPFSNLQGVQHIAFPRGGIRETFGDVLATIRREFG